MRTLEKPATVFDLVAGSLLHPKARVVSLCQELSKRGRECCEETDCGWKVRGVRTGEQGLGSSRESGGNWVGMLSSLSSTDPRAPLPPFGPSKQEAI